MPHRALLIAATALTFACGDKDGDSGDAGSGLSSEDTATAEALWTEIAGYDGWNQDAAWVGVQESEDETHGSHVQIWFNDAAADSFAAAGSEMDEGSVLVKEGYDSASESDLNGVTVMKKSGGDWFWAKYGADGSISTAGEAAAGSCGGCHASGKDSIRFISW